MPFKAVAKQLRISEGTVRNRYLRMKKSRVLSVVAAADPTMISYRSDAMVGIKVASTATPADVASRLKGHPEVVYLLWVSGRYDLLAEIVVDSEKGLEMFLQSHCYGRADIASVEVMTGIVMYKNQFLLKSPVKQ
jgi:Lrp/AsnC family transcriptional regulator for asnA, asnC and gidA